MFQAANASTDDGRLAKAWLDKHQPGCQDSLWTNSQLTAKKALSAFFVFSDFWLGAAVFGFQLTFHVHSGFVSKSEHVIVHPQALFELLTVWSNQPG